MNQEIANIKSEDVGRTQLIAAPVFIASSIFKPLWAGLAALLFAAAVAVVAGMVRGFRKILKRETYGSRIVSNSG